MEKEITISSVAREPREYNGVLQRGVKEGDVWYNVPGKTEEEINKLFIEDQLAKGNKVKVKMDDVDDRKITGFIELLEKGSHDDDIVNLETLLNDAHKKGIVGIETNMIDFDKEKDRVVFRASVVMKGQPTKVFQGHGDASKEDSEEHMKKHYIRIGETRAIVRALRWATNNAQASAEEIGQTAESDTEKGTGPPTSPQDSPTSPDSQQVVSGKAQEFSDSHISKGQKSLELKKTKTEKKKGSETEVREYE